MKIEVGKVYTVSPQYKKSTYEVEQYFPEDENAGFKGLNVQTCWRGGTWVVKVANTDEAEALQDSIGEDGEDWDSDNYENLQMDSTWDGQGEEWIKWGSAWEEDEFESLQKSYEEELYENDETEYFGFNDWLEDNGFFADACSYYIEGGIIVEEVTDEQVLEWFE